MSRNLNKNKGTSIRGTSERARISAVVLTRNEATQIVDCLRSIRWCDEIVLIDDSSDRTIELAKDTVKSEKLRIYNLHKRDDFAALRNFGLKKAKNDWVLFIDADHRVSAKLREEIVKALSQQRQKFRGFRIRQLDYFAGRLLRHGETAHISHILLGRRGSGEWKRRVHEFWDIRGKVGTISEPILHYPHQTVREFLEHINRWSTLDAQVFTQQGASANFVKVLAYPSAKFLVNYIMRFGFLDGFPGLIVAFMMSLHSLLVRIKLIFGG